MLTDARPAIGIIVGSSREGSFNRALAGLATAAADLTPIEGIDLLPIFSQDLEADTPAEVARLRSEVEALDALLIVTPEYNASMPGALKNAIDWLSRPYGASALSGLPVAVIGASPSGGGAAGAVSDAVRVLKRAGAQPLEETITVPRAHEALPADATLPGRLAELLGKLGAAAQERAAA